jgi:glycosyltransferase involved in cell wall biosynthesis
MNILFIEDSSRTLNGGGQRVSSIVISSLKTNNNVIWYADYFMNHNLISRLNNSDHLIKLLDINRKSKLHLFSNILFPFCFILNYINLFIIIKRNKIDLIYTTTKKSLLIGGIVGITRNLPYFYHIHMLLQGKRSDIFISYLMKKAKICISVSDYVTKEFNKIGVSSIITLPNPIDVKLANSHRTLEKDQILRVAFIGTLIFEKGVEILLQSMSELTTINVILNIYGIGPTQNQLINKYGSNSNIHFHGFVQNINNVLDDEVDVLVLPTIIKEAAPIVIQQAMAKGIPIITTDIGGQSSFVENFVTGILVPISDSTAISKAIKYLAFNPYEYIRISKNCLFEAKKFTTLEEFNNSIKSTLSII